MAKKSQSSSNDQKWRTAKSGFPDVWKPEEDGDALECYVISVRPGKFGMVYRVREYDGEKRTLALPSHTALIGLLEDNRVKAASVIRVICDHVGSRKRGDYYEYTLSIRTDTEEEVVDDDAQF